MNFISAQTVDTVLDAALNRKNDLSPAILGTLPEDAAGKVRRTEIRQ